MKLCVLLPNQPFDGVFEMKVQAMAVSFSYSWENDRFSVCYYSISSDARDIKLVMDKNNYRVFFYISIQLLKISLSRQDDTGYKECFAPS